MENASCVACSMTLSKRISEKILEDKSETLTKYQILFFPEMNERFQKALKWQ